MKTIDFLCENFIHLPAAIGKKQKWQKKMERLTKSEIVCIINELGRIVENSSTNNCYDAIVDFFKRTSFLYDHREEIESLPIRGHKFLHVKNSTRIDAEDKREKFFCELEKLGRNLHGHNRTRRGEEVTKEKIFFGDYAFSIARCETFTHDKNLQTRIRNEIITFLWFSKSSLKTDWLK